MNKKNIKALALASIFSFSLASGKFNQNKVCADILPEIAKFVAYGGIGFLAGFAFNELSGGGNKPDNKDINHDYDTNLINMLGINGKKTMPFSNIPLLRWQDSNCFFLAVLYTLYGPENIEIYKKVANMTIEQAGKAYLDFCKTYNCVDLSRFGINNNQFITDDNYFKNISGYLVNGCAEFRNMIRGFIELCKLLVRMHDEAIPGQGFQIIPRDMTVDEYGFEKIICGGYGLRDRGWGFGSPHEVFCKFVLVNNPLLLASGDKSKYAMWGLGDVHQPAKIENINQISFEIQGENGNYSMDQNGKINIKGKDYYLAAFYRRQGDRDGHILCRQPKYKFDEKNNIKLDGVLKLSCLSSSHVYDKKNTMFDVLNESVLELRYDLEGNNPLIIGGANFGFRFVPEEEMLKHQEFYFSK